MRILAVTFLLGLPLAMLGRVPGAPTPRHFESMVYELAAADAHIEGDVVVRLNIGADGSVVSAVATAGPPILRKDAEANARKWTFVPGEQGRLDVTYSFRLKAPYVVYAAPTVTIFDLPNHVTVATNFREIAGHSSHLK